MPDLDFSVYHPLDHWAFSVECFHWYGGPTRHLSLWWDYQTPSEIEAYARLWLFCKRGKHEFRPYWQGKGPGFDPSQTPSGYDCAWCPTEGKGPSGRYLPD